MRSMHGAMMGGMPFHGAFASMLAAYRGMMGSQLCPIRWEVSSGKRHSVTAGTNPLRSAS
jgi:hypothetical protein